MHDLDYICRNVDHDNKSCFSKLVKIMSLVDDLIFSPENKLNMYNDLSICFVPLFTVPIVYYLSLITYPILQLERIWLSFCVGSIILLYHVMFFYLLTCGSNEKLLCF